VTPNTLPPPPAIRSRLLVAVFAIAIVAALHFYGFATWAGDVWASRHQPYDFPIYREATTHLFDGQLYEWSTTTDRSYIYPYSPVFAWLFVPFAIAGIEVWWGLHLACVALIPNWTIRVAVLLSWGFWMDTWEGNVTAFFMLAGYWAVRGNRWGGWAFLILALLIPKPQFLAGLIWLLWREPSYRKGFVGIVLGLGLLTLATGYAFDWLAALPGASHDVDNPYQFLPSRIIGAWWLLIGIPLGLWLIRKDHPGWAGLAMSLYAGAPQLLLLTMERRLPWWLWPTARSRSRP
jgi:hypothetical protein